MPLGEYKKPQAGPKIGKETDASDLPAHKQAAIGDFQAELEKKTMTDPPPPSVEAPPVSEEDEARVQLGIETLEALKSIHEQEDEMEPEVDPIDAAAEPTEEDKQEFLRALFGSKPYTKLYRLFGDESYTIRMSDLTPAEEEQLYTQLAKAEIPAGDDWTVTLDRLRLVAYAKNFSWDGADPPQQTVVPVAVANERINKLPSAIVYSALMRCARIFRRHLEIMIERSLDSDFWKVDGSNSQPVPLPEDPSTTAGNPDSEVGTS